MMKLPDDYAGETAKAYRQAVQRFNLWNGGKTLTPGRVREHFLYLREHYRPASIRLAKSALRKCYRPEDMAFWRTTRTGRPSAGPEATDFLKPATVKELIKISGQKTGSMIEFLYLTGARIDECLKIKIADCRPVERKIHISVSGKGGADRRFQISQQLFKRIADAFEAGEYLFQRGDTHYKRCWAWKQIKQAGESIGRPDVHPHSFRHAIATSLLNEGENLVAVADFLGHSSVATTSRYYRGRVKDSTLKKLEKKLS